MRVRGRGFALMLVLIAVAAVFALSMAALRAERRQAHNAWTATAIAAADMASVAAFHPLTAHRNLSRCLSPAGVRRLSSGPPVLVVWAG